MAIQLGAGFVGRSFSGDKDQLVPLLKAAMQFKGFSLIDIISPCVTFNNHVGSTKSYDHIREHNESVSSLDFVPIGEEIKASYKEGSKIDVPLHDGAIITLEKLSKKYNPLDKGKAIQGLNEAEKDGKVLTGLLYINPKVKDHAEILNIADTPLNQFKEADLCPGKSKLAQINASLN
jgi:2-oxoglutarate ferredoxin oxidoreductase subunit beta